MNWRTLAEAILKMLDDPRANYPGMDTSDQPVPPVMLKAIAAGAASLTATISTVHISLATKTILEERGDKNPWGHCAVYEYGFCVYIPSEDMADDGFEEPVPEDLRAVWNWGRECGFGWVRLDADATIIDDLPEYDWDIEVAQRKAPGSHSPSP